MANKFQFKRTTVSGRTPNTTNSSNTTFIDKGELAFNLADRKLYSSDSANGLFEIGSNVSTLSVQTISANGSVGSAGQALVSNGSAVYWSNNPGYTGSQGTTGFTGSKGDAGTTGFTGSAGAQGTTGFTGSKGDTGATGFTGSAGEQGATGFTGSQGTQGTTGFTGSKGDAGSTGFTGSAGVQGTTGFTGSQGTQGTTGFTGSKGDTGATGFTGSAGAQGTTGFTGSKGDIGYTGSKGEPGTFGGAAFDYTFDTDTTLTDPGDGFLKFNNTAFSSANTLIINDVDDTTASVYSYLQTIDDSTSLIKGHFTVTEKANTSNFTQFSITGAHVHSGNSFQVPVAYLAGVTSFTDNLDIIITFARTGDRGDTGFTGSQGATGFTGSKGDTGTTGFTGSKGDTGATGFTGSQGIQGVIGYTGSKGDTGATGFTGSKGDTGATGFTGSKGDQGVIGYTGSKGDTGATGFTGSQGIQGPIGYTGSQGIQGPIGYTGSQGIQGVIGYTGSKGDQGVIGYTGSKGDTGTTGFTGSKGDTGATGFTGSKGDTGSTGFTGSKGDTGSTGFTGSQGVQGFTGSAGPAGGANTQIQFNDSGVANGATGFTFNKTTNATALPGTLAAGNTTITGFANVSTTLQVTGQSTFSANTNHANNYVVRPVLTAYTEHEISNTAVSLGTYTLDLSTSNFWDLTLTGNVTFAFSNPPTAGRVYSGTIAVKQDASGGRTVTWPSEGTVTLFPGGVSPPETTTANAKDIWSFMTYDGGTTYIVSLSVKDAK